MERSITITQRFTHWTIVDAAPRHTGMCFLCTVIGRTLYALSRRQENDLEVDGYDEDIRRLCGRCAGQVTGLGSEENVQFVLTGMHTERRIRTDLARLTWVPLPGESVAEPVWGEPRCARCTVPRKDIHCLFSWIVKIDGIFNRSEHVRVCITCNAQLLEEFQERIASKTTTALSSDLEKLGLGPQQEPLKQ